MATYSTDRNFSTGLLYALKKLGRPNISLKKDQIMSVEAIYMTEKLSTGGYQLFLKEFVFPSPSFYSGTQRTSCLNAYKSTRDFSRDTI